LTDGRFVSGWTASLVPPYMLSEASLLTVRGFALWGRSFSTMGTWLDAVRSEVYTLVEAAIPELTTVFDEVAAQRVTWREMVEAAEQGDTERLHLTPPWLVIEWGTPVASEDYAITCDVYEWPLSLVVAFSVAGASNVAKTTETMLLEAEKAIEAVRAAMRAHNGPTCQFLKHMGNHDAKNPANELFLTYGLPFHGVVFDAVILCGQT